jgi:hypothetical protein
MHTPFHNAYTVAHSASDCREVSPKACPAASDLAAGSAHLVIVERKGVVGGARLVPGRAKKLAQECDVCLGHCHVYRGAPTRVSRLL